MPRLTELRTRLDGLFAQICNNRWLSVAKSLSSGIVLPGVEELPGKVKY